MKNEEIILFDEQVRKLFFKKQNKLNQTIIENKLEDILARNGNDIAVSSYFFFDLL